MNCPILNPSRPINLDQNIIEKHSVDTGHSSLMEVPIGFQMWDVINTLDIARTEVSLLCIKLSLMNETS